MTTRTARAMEAGGAAVEMRPPAEVMASRVFVFYIAMWIAEGAVRKWVPGTEQIFYVLRDGVLILAIAGIGSTGYRARSRTGAGTALLTLGFVLALIAGVQVILGLLPLQAALLGWRSYAAPLLFLAYTILFVSRVDLGKAVRWVLIATLVNVVVVLAQVFSPAGAYINKDVGADAAYFVNAGGIVRPSGTFSAPIGLTEFTAIAFALSLFALHYLRAIKRLLVVSALISTVFIIAVSGSRGLVLNAVVVLGAYIAMQLLSGRSTAPRNIVLIGAVGIEALFAVGSIAPQVLDSFQTRFIDASRSEDTAGRIFSQAFDFLVQPLTWLGDGIGARSQAGILSGSTQTWIEVEKTRWVAELGLLGLILGWARTAIGPALMLWCLFARRPRDLGAPLLAAVIFPAIAWGSIGVIPSTQAFAGIAFSLLFLLMDKDRQPSAEVVSRSRAPEASVRH